MENPSNTSTSDSPSLRRNIDQSRDPRSSYRRSVKFSAVPSSAIMRAIMSNVTTTKTKTQRRTSRMAERSFPKLIFDYGPTAYRGLLLHRKIKLAPFAEHFQKKYPQIRVYYHPITEYNVISVRLKDCIVVRMLLSNVTHSATEDITKNPFYKLIDQAIHRIMQYPNLLIKPFRDAICLMTHNLDSDYDVPWYRTEFPRSVPVDSLQPQSDYANSSQQFVIAAPCLVTTDAPKAESVHWKNFVQSIENSLEFEKMLESESLKLEEVKRLNKE